MAEFGRMGFYDFSSSTPQQRAKYIRDWAKGELGKSAGTDKFSHMMDGVRIGHEGKHYDEVGIGLFYLAKRLYAHTVEGMTSYEAVGSKKVGDSDAVLIKSLNKLVSAVAHAVYYDGACLLGKSVPHILG